MSIIANLSDRDYHASSHLGSTTAVLADESLRLFADRILGIDRVEEKPHFALGRLIHMAVLEPERFARCVVATGPINPKTGEPYGRATKAFADWQEQNPDKTVVEPWIHLAIERMPDEVCDILSRGRNEMSVFQEIDGVKVKCRPDNWQGNTIWDLKSIACIRDAERAITRRKYWFSDAWYRSVCQAETGESHDMGFIFVEKSYPLRWQIVKLAADYRMYADARMKLVRDKIKRGLETLDWNDDPTEPILASMPDWMDVTSDDDGEDD